MPATAKKAAQPVETQPAIEPIHETEGKVTTIYPAQKASAEPAQASPRVAKTTTAPKPKAKKAERVPAADVIALLGQAGITRSQLAAAMKVSPSLVTEWVGKGRGNLLARSRWAEVQKTAKAFAKGLK